jgi:hypothetical protein
LYKLDRCDKDPYCKFVNSTIPGFLRGNEIMVSWVRWIAGSAIPIERLVLKYGKLYKDGFSDEDYSPYRS